MAAHICNSITQQTETIDRISSSRPAWTIWLDLVLKKKIQFNLVKRFSQVSLMHAICVLAITVDRLPPAGIDEVLLWETESVQGLALAFVSGNELAFPQHGYAAAKQTFLIKSLVE